MRLLNLCVVVLLVARRGLCLRDQVRVHAARRAHRQDARRRPARTRRHRGAARRMGNAGKSGALQGLARRHLHLHPAEATQYDSLDRLPERPPTIVQPAASDPIGRATDNCRTAATGALRRRPERRRTRSSADRRAERRRRQPAVRRPSRGDAAHAHAALRPQRRSRRQGAGARRSGDPGFHRGLCRDRRAARHVRGRAG